MIILRRRKTTNLIETITSTTITNSSLPEFVKMKTNGTTFKYIKSDSMYWCYNGSWGVNVKLRLGKLYSVHKFVDSVNDIELIPVTEEWTKSTYGG